MAAVMTSFVSLVGICVFVSITAPYHYLDTNQRHKSGRSSSPDLDGGSDWESSWRRTLWRGGVFELTFACNSDQST
jgi:hypothetical protein